MYERYNQKKPFIFCSLKSFGSVDAVELASYARLKLWHTSFAEQFSNPRLNRLLSDINQQGMVSSDDMRSHAAPRVSAERTKPQRSRKVR